MKASREKRKRQRGRMEDLQREINRIASQIAVSQAQLAVPKLLIGDPKDPAESEYPALTGLKFNFSPGTQKWIEDLTKEDAWKGKYMPAPFEMGKIQSDKMLELEELKMQLYRDQEKKIQYEKDKQAAIEEKMKAEEQNYAKKVQASKDMQARIDSQIAKQVAEWRSEVESGNSLIGMMLAEAHPKIVTYDFAFLPWFGLTPVLPKFIWPEKPPADPELEKEAVEKEAAESGTPVEEILGALALAKAAQAGDGKNFTEAQMKALMAEAAKKKKMSPEERAQLKDELTKLEAQKADWERKEREIAQGFQGKAYVGGKPQAYGGDPVRGRTPEIGGGVHLNTKANKNLEVQYPVGVTAYLQLRGEVPIDIKCDPIKSFTAKSFDGMTVGPDLLRALEEGKFEAGELQGESWQVFSEEKKQAIVGKLFARMGGMKYSAKDASEIHAGRAMTVQLWA